jgi:hypothetical protein
LGLSQVHVSRLERAALCSLREQAGAFDHVQRGATPGSGRSPSRRGGAAGDAHLRSDDRWVAPATANAGGSI